MARKRMSLRAIARMKRENRELRNTLSGVKTGGCGTRITRLNLLSSEDGKIKTAHLLGYTTLLRDNYDGTFGVVALKIDG